MTRLDEGLLLHNQREEDRLAVFSDHYAPPATPLPVPSTPRQELPFQFSPGSVPAPVVADSLPTLPLHVTTVSGIPGTKALRTFGRTA